jgi:MFS family permease
MIVFGLGLACLVAPLVSTVMGAADENDVGIASGVNNAVARSASLLAVAVIPPLAGLTGEKYTQPVAMAHSYKLTVAICIVVLIVGAVAVLLTVPSRHPVPEEISDDAGN